MKKLIYLIVLIVAFGLIVAGCIPVVPPVEQSNTGNLTKTNIDVPGDRSTIQAAIDAAGPGDTIKVADGTYTITAAINVNKGVTITGNVANPENVVVQYSPASTSLNGFEIGAADITIQGFKIIDCFRGVHFGRSDVISTGCTITNCVFDNNHENAIGEVAAENTTISNNAITNCNMGIEIRANEATSIAKRTEVTGNTISSCSQSCIQTYRGKYVYISGNTISNTNDKGINIIGSSATSSNERIQVISNDISGTVADGIQLTKWGSCYPRYVYIHGNTISDIHTTGISVREVQAAGTADRVEVSGNTISDTYFEGITVQYSSPYTYVYDNTLTGCNYYGFDGTGDWDYASIHVEDSDGCGGSHHTVIDSNTISDGINGIQTWSDDVTITNNEIYSMGNTYADTKLVSGRTYKNSGILVGSNWGSGDIDPTGVIIENNSIHDNYWGLFYSADLTNGVDATCNWWGSHDGPSGEGPGTGDAVSTQVDFDPWIGITDLSGPINPVQLDNPANISFSFSCNIGTATLDLGDGTQFYYYTNSEIDTIVPYAYSEAGVYTVTLTIENGYGGSYSREFHYVVVYDPADDPTSGFVTGGGWIDSPAGAYRDDITLSGKATFGFVSKYKKGANVPTGNTEFKFKAGDLNFHSDSYDWLVIAGDKAMYKGKGTINGTRDCKFMLSAIDGDGDPDMFRIKIWDYNDSVIYDNGWDGRVGTELGGGQIVIHKK